MSVYHPTEDQLRTFGAILAERHAFRKYTNREPDAVMVPPDFMDGAPRGATTLFGMPVVLGTKFALVFDIPGATDRKATDD